MHDEHVHWYQSIVEASPDAVLVVASNGEISLASGQVERLFGYGRGELLGEMLEILLPERFLLRHMVLRDGHFADPQRRRMAQGGELWAKRKDGSELPVEVGLSPLRTPSGQYVIAWIRDAGVVRRAREQLKVFLEAVPDAAFVVSEAGKIILSNTRAERSFGFVREALAGRDIDLLFPDRVRRLGTFERNGYFKSLRALAGEPQALWCRRKDGREFPAELSLSEIDSDAGPQALAMLRDLSDRRLSPAEVGALNAAGPAPAGGEPASAQATSPQPGAG